MQNFICHAVQYYKPIQIRAKNESDAKKIMSKKMSSIEHTEIMVRNENQHWFKTWIENNF